MCTEMEVARNDKEQTFEDFKRIILDGAVNCEDEGQGQD
jgi:hypothetical protein